MKEVARLLRDLKNVTRQTFSSMLLKGVRAGLEFSQEEMANQVGIDNYNFSRWEEGDISYRGSLALLRAFAKKKLQECVFFREIIFKEIFQEGVLSQEKKELISHIRSCKECRTIEPCLRKNTVLIIDIKGREKAYFSEKRRMGFKKHLDNCQFCRRELIEALVGSGGLKSPKGSDSDLDILEEYGVINPRQKRTLSKKIELNSLYRVLASVENNLGQFQRELQSEIEKISKIRERIVLFSKKIR